MKFCNYHIKTKENPEGTDCAADLDAGRCYKCPYTIKEIYISRSDLEMSHNKGSPLGMCVNFQASEEGLGDIINHLILSNPDKLPVHSILKVVSESLQKHN